MFNVAAGMLWVYIVQCKRDKITQVLPCLLTVALGTTKIYQHGPLNCYIKRHVMTMIYIPTTCRHNAMTIDVVEITTSPHPTHC